jgi:hypothetical protein
LQKQLFLLAPKIKGVLIFYAVIFANLALILARKHAFENPELAEASTHISNFALSSMILALMSFIMALQGGTFKLVIYLGLIIIALNVVVEGFIRILNTPDLVDAAYGVAGVIVTTGIMYIFYLVGINKESKKPAELSLQK